MSLKCKWEARPIDHPQIYYPIYQQLLKASINNLELSITQININIFYGLIVMRKALSLISLTFTPLLLDGQKQEVDSKRHAICILYPNQSPARGIISFSQDSIQSPVKIACSVKGLNPNSKHGFHIYQFGDLTTKLGQHYNPHNKSHGSPFGQEKHAGDLGNLQSDPFGNGYMCFVHSSLTLHGDSSILGRAVGINSKEDDLGRSSNPDSLKNGSTGHVIASGVIGLSKEFKIVPPFAQ